DRPLGLDFNPNGTVLYVANNAGRSISVIDLIQRKETRRVTFEAPQETERPTYLATAKNGLVLFATATPTSSNLGHMYEFDPNTLASNPVRIRSDYAHFGITANTHPKASPDRSVIAALNPDAVAAEVYAYSSATNEFREVAYIDSGTPDFVLDE